MTNGDPYSTISAARPTRDAVLGVVIPPAAPMRGQSTADSFTAPAAGGETALVASNPGSGLRRWQGRLCRTDREEHVARRQ